MYSFYNGRRAKMSREKYQILIEERIKKLPAGSVFIPSDFADIAPTAAINMALSRLESDGMIRRIMRGIYDKPQFSKLLKEFVAADPAKVAYAIARKNRWSIIPMGDTALNFLRLTTQVPAVWQYVSDGPYKEYSYQNIQIIFRRTSNKEATRYSYTTGLIIQGLRALGKNSVDKKIIQALSTSLSLKEKRSLLKEAKGTTAWIYDYIKEICREQNNDKYSSFKDEKEGSSFYKHCAENEDASGYY